MNRSPRTSGYMPNLLLAALLLSAQFGALLHAYEHDPGAPQAKVCSTCTTASQLSSACVDTHEDQVIVPSGACCPTADETRPGSVGPVLVHQRDPPPAL